MVDDIQLTFITVLKLAFYLFCILNGFDHSLNLTKTIQSSNMIYDRREEIINLAKCINVKLDKTNKKNFEDKRKQTNIL